MMAPRGWHTRHVKAIERDIPDHPQSRRPAGKNTGDGFLVEFRASWRRFEVRDRDAGADAERNDHLPADRVMQFRMGVHMGDVIADEDEVSRRRQRRGPHCEAIAVPGGVAVSAKAYQEPASISAPPLSTPAVIV